MDDIPAAAAKGSAVSLACAVFLLVRIYKGRAGPTSVRAVAIFFIIPVFLTGATLRVRSVRNISSLKESLDNLISSTDCTFSGFISDISLDNDKTIYFIEDACVNSYTGSVKVTLKGSFEDEYRIGDYAEGTGKLRKPNPPANPGGFDEEAYYTVRGIDGLITATGMQTKEVYEEDVSVSLKRFVRNLRLDAIKGLRESLGPDEAAVLSAVLTGERGLIDDEIKESLATGGISHILAVSGLHISLIANGMYSLLMRITGRKKLNSVITIFFLLMYGIFAGMPVSAVRAIIMSSCMLLSRFFGKSYDMMSSLSLAGLFILFVNPLYVRDSSFIMSFCAAAGAAFGQEISCGARIGNTRLRGVVTVFSIYLFLLPVLIETYYYVSPYSVVINIIVIPLMSLLVPCGAILILASLLFGGVPARFAGGICHYIVKGMIFLGECSKDLPFNRIIIGHRGPKVLILYFSVLLMTLMLVMFFRRKKPLWVLTACIIIFIHFPDTGTTVHMLDVGQGECILIEDGKEKILVDAGSSNVTKVYKYRIGPFLKYMGIDTIDRMILTHADNDHKNGMEELFGDSDIEVKEFMVADTDDNGAGLAKLSKEPCGVRTVAAGDELFISPGSRINVLSPVGGSSAEKNDKSIVFLFRSNEITALFTGDSSSKAERTYIEGLGEEKIDVLKVAHHGSKYSTGEELLAKTRPAIGIVSASATNRYGHPSPETVKRLEKAGCNIFATPECGYIRIRSDGKNISVVTMKNKMTYI